MTLDIGWSYSCESSSHGKFQGAGMGRTGYLMVEDNKTLYSYCKLYEILSELRFNCVSDRGYTIHSTYIMMVRLCKLHSVAKNKKFDGIIVLISCEFCLFMFFVVLILFLYFLFIY